MIKIDFEFETPHGKFADALYLAEDHNLTDDEIQSMKEQRRDNWIAIVTSPPQEPILETIEIDNITYQKIEGVPPSGATVIEKDGIWYYKV
jgi:hypothetical protein